MKEWHRTIILVLLLIVAIGFVAWLRSGYETRMLDILR